MLKDLLTGAGGATLVWNLTAAFFASLPEQWKDVSAYRVFRNTGLRFLSMQNHAAPTTLSPAVPLAGPATAKEP